MTKYKVGDYIKVDVGAFETFGQGTRIEGVKVVDVDKYDPTHTYAISDRRGRRYWVDSKYIVEYELEDEQNEQNELEERYTTGSGKQLYDVLEDDLLEPDEARGFYKGNIYKYVKRYPKKNGIEDLEKARDYIELLIKLEKKLGEME